MVSPVLIRRQVEGKKSGTNDPQVIGSNLLSHSGGWIRTNDLRVTPALRRPTAPQLLRHKLPAPAGGRYLHGLRGWQGPFKAPNTRPGGQVPGCCTTTLYGALRRAACGPKEAGVTSARIPHTFDRRKHRFACTGGLRFASPWRASVPKCTTETTRLRRKVHVEAPDTQGFSKVRLGGKGAGAAVHSGERQRNAGHRTASPGTRGARSPGPSNLRRPTH